MASKAPLLFAAVFVAAVLAAPVAQAQVLALGQLAINGTVHCSVNASTATTAVFPNALVQLQCGRNVAASTTTDSNGAFGLSLSLLSTNSLLTAIIADCKLAVNTPLSTCNTSLPSTGILRSSLTLLGDVGRLLGSIVSLIPSGFSLVV